MSKKKQQKVYLKDSIGLLNASASGIALITLFTQIFLMSGLEAVMFTGPLLIAFTICAYLARARFLGYKFPSSIHSFMIGFPVVVILLSLWEFISAI